MKRVSLLLAGIFFLLVAFIPSANAGLYSGGELCIYENAHMGGSAACFYQTTLNQTAYANFRGTGINNEVSSVYMGGWSPSYECRVVLYKNFDMTGATYTLGYGGDQVWQDTVDYNWLYNAKSITDASTQVWMSDGTPLNDTASSATITCRHV